MPAETLSNLASAIRITLNERSDKSPDQARKAFKRAKAFYGSAKKRQDKKATAFWKARMHTAKASLSAQGASTDTTVDKAVKTGTKLVKGAEKAALSKYASFKAAVAKAADHPSPDAVHHPKKSLKDALKEKAAKAAASLVGAPAAMKKLVTEPAYRKELGMRAASTIKKVAATSVLHALHEIEELGAAGKAVVKAASGGKLTKSDKHAIVKGAKALALTAIGTIAIGGLSHFAAGALAQHFAAETAVKSLGRAALYADNNDTSDITTNMWARDVLNHVMTRFANLDQMDPEELAKILKPVIGAEVPTPEATEAED
jgi:hypothetical protein